MGINCTLREPSAWNQQQLVKIVLPAVSGYWRHRTSSISHFPGYWPSTTWCVLSTWPERGWFRASASGPDASVFDTTLGQWYPLLEPYHHMGLSPIFHEELRPCLNVIFSCLDARSRLCSWFSTRLVIFSSGTSYLNRISAIAHLVY